MNDKVNQKGMSALVAGIAGLLLGVLGTAAIALSDEETRKKAAKKAKQLQHTVKKLSDRAVHDLQKNEKAGEGEQRGEEKVLSN